MGRRSFVVLREPEACRSSVCLKYAQLCPVINQAIRNRVLNAPRSSQTEPRSVICVAAYELNVRQISTLRAITRHLAPLLIPNWGGMRINHCVLVLISVLLIACREEAPTAPEPLPPPPPPSSPWRRRSRLSPATSRPRGGAAPFPSPPVSRSGTSAASRCVGSSVRVRGQRWWRLDRNHDAPRATPREMSPSATGSSARAPAPTPSRRALSGAGTVSTTVVATARNPRWTILVYLAADNNLAPFGVADLDEMERAGSDPEVQIVIQGEFSASDLKYSPCPSCVGAQHLPISGAVHRRHRGRSRPAGRRHRQP